MRRMIREKIPAATSSIIIPHPPFIRSRRFIGKGLIISNMRNSIKPVIQANQLNGNPKKVIRTAAVSSITTSEGSLRLNCRSKELLAHKPMTKRQANNTTCRKRLCGRSVVQYHSKTPTTVPAVPGIRGTRPVPPTVANQKAADLFL